MPAHLDDGVRVMPLGLVLLFGSALLVFFGLAHRVLDRMRLTDGQALVILGLMAAGSFLDIPVFRGPFTMTVNLGGAVVPVGVSIYLLMRAERTEERLRALLATLVTGALISIIAGRFHFGPHGATSARLPISPLWLFGVLAGVVGYVVAGRSRRASFIAGTLGLLLADTASALVQWSRGLPSTLHLGGAGALDAIVIAGILAVGLAEVFGESMERLVGGPRLGNRPAALRQDEGLFVDKRNGGEPRE